MFDEPHICKENYMHAEAVVLAESEEQALELLENEGSWNMEEIKRIKPRVIALDHPAMVSKLIG
jgi:hypothetical protein